MNGEQKGTNFNKKVLLKNQIINGGGVYFLEKLFSWSYIIFFYGLIAEKIMNEWGQNTVDAIKQNLIENFFA